MEEACPNYNNFDFDKWRALQDFGITHSPQTRIALGHRP